MPAPRIVEIEDLARLLPRRGRLIGLDVGTKTVGVAVSDGLRRMASPVETLRRTKFRADAARLVSLARERDTVAFILGWPLNMDGSQGPRCQSTRQFAHNLIEAFETSDFAPLMSFWDERLSTAAIERSMIEEGDLSRAKRARSIDAGAAAYILQGALDRLAGLAAAPAPSPSGAPQDD